MKRSVNDLEVQYSELAEEWRVERRREHARLRQQRWYSENVVVKRNLSKQYYAKNADKVRERMRRNYRRKMCQVAAKQRQLARRETELTEGTARDASSRATQGGRVIPKQEKSTD